jgi:hypothetical protein
MSEINPNRSNLDQTQIFQRAFNEDTDRIRVDAEITASIISPPGLEVSISAVDDNIAIRNSNNNNELLINADGSINVNASVSIAPNSSINLNQILGTSTAVNNGIANNGTQRVTIASDNTPFTVNAAQLGTWTTGRTWNLLNTTDSVNVGNFPSTFGVTQSTTPWIVDGSSFTQPVSGTLTVNQGTSPWVTSFSSPQHVILDSGTLTSITNPVIVNQGTSPWVVSGSITTSPNVNIHDSAGSSLSSTGTSLNVNVTNTIPVSQSGTWNINNITGTISLPSGAATSANQVTEISSLATINTSINALQVAQGSTTSGELGPLIQGAVTTSAPTYINGRTDPLSLTTAGALRVDGSGTTQPVSGTVTALQGTSPWVVSGTITTSPNVNVHDGTGVSISSTGSSLNVNVTNTIPVSQSGSWTVTANAGTGTFLVDGSAHTQPISGTIIANIGTTGGLALDTTVSGLLTNTQLRASPVPVSGTLTVNQGTSPWIISGAVTTSISNDTNYGTVGANTLRTASQIGNATGAAAFGAGTTTAQVLRVVLPTDQTAIPVTQSTSPWVVSGTVSVNPITFASPQHVILDSGTLTSITNPVTVNQGTSPWVVSGSVTTSPNVNVHDGAGVSISSTGSSLNVDVTNTIPVSQSGAWTVTALQGTSPWVVSGTVTSNIGTTGGLALDSSLSTINTTLGTLLTNTQLRATPVPISGTVSVSNFPAYDTNYGTVGANTLRGAAQIGNATGAADFNAGATGAQTLRVTANAGVNLNTSALALDTTVSGLLTNTQLRATPVPVSGTITVNQGTSPWIISGAVTLPYDTNYGTVGANTLRTASEIGNATGAANFNYGTIGAQSLRTASQIGNATGASDFNAGVTGAQTLRTTSNITRNGTELDYNFGAASANTLRVADLIGNATGPADFGAGASTAQTLRVTASNFPTTLDTNFGTVGANTLRTASEIGNATGAASFNEGTSNAQTLRVTSNPGSDRNVVGTITALNGTVAINTQGCGTVGFQANGTWVATLVVEITYDDATWFIAPSLDTDTTQTTNPIYVFSFTNALNNDPWMVNVSGARQCRLRASAFTSGTVNIVLNASVANGFITQIPVTEPATYSATSASGGFVTANNATDIFTITGSATRNIRVLRIGYSASQTNQQIQNIVLLKRSTANTVGTSTISTNVSYDSLDPAGTATVRSYTANPTVGTLVANVRTAKIVVPASGGGLGTGATSPPLIEWDFSQSKGKEVYLRGVNEVLAINLNATTISGNSTQCYVEWMEF